MRVSCIEGDPGYELWHRIVKEEYGHIIIEVQGDNNKWRTISHAVHTADDVTGYVLQDKCTYDDELGRIISYEIDHEKGEWKREEKTYLAVRIRLYDQHGAEIREQVA